MIPAPAKSARSAAVNIRRSFPFRFACFEASDFRSTQAKAWKEVAILFCAFGLQRESVFYRLVICVMGFIRADISLATKFFATTAYEVLSMAVDKFRVVKCKFIIEIE